MLETVNNIVKAFDNIGMSAPLMIGVFASLGKTIKALGTGSALTVTGGSIFSNLLGRAGIQIPQTLQQSTTATEGFRVALTNVSGASMLASAKTAVLTAGVTLLNTVMTGLAIGAIALVCKALYDYANANQIAHDKIKENIDTTKSNISSYTQQKNSLKDIAEEYDKLANKTDKTKEETERYHELQKQVAEIAPDLVSGEDRYGNPILSLNGSLEDYIDNLDEAIERQQRLLSAQQNALASKSMPELKKFVGKDAVIQDGLKNLSKTSDAYDDSRDLSGMFNKARLKSFEDGANKYIEIVEKRNNEVIELNDQLTQNYEDFASIEAEQEQAVINKLENNPDRYKAYNKLYKDGIKNSAVNIKNLLQDFNWGSEIVDSTSKQNKMIRNFNKLSESLDGNNKKIIEWRNVMDKANESYQQTGDIESYQKAIKGVATELASLTGTNVQDWITGFTKPLEGALDESSIALNEYLKNYKKSFTDIEMNDPVAIRIKTEFEATNNFLEEITSAGDYQGQMDILVNYKNNEAEMDKLPYQLQRIITGSFDGGDKLKDWELPVIMTLATQIQSNGEFDNGTFSLITKMLNGTMTEAEIKAGIKLDDEHTLNSEVVGQINELNKNKDMNIKVGVEADDHKLRKDLETILKGNDNKQLRLDLIANFDDRKFQSFADSIKDLDTDKQIDIVETFVQNGDLTASEYEQLLSSLPEEVQTYIRSEFDDSGVTDAENSIYNLKEVYNILIDIQDDEARQKLTDFANKLDTLIKDKNLKLDLLQGVNDARKGEGVDGLLDAMDKIKQLPKEQRIQILADITDFSAKMNEADRKKIADKSAEVIGDTSDADSKLDNYNKKDAEDKNSKITADASQANNTTDNFNKKELEDKSCGLYAHDVNASSTIKEINGMRIAKKTAEIVVSVVETVKGAWNWLVNRGGSKGGVYSKNYQVPSHKSISDFTNISDNPVAIDDGVSAQSMDFNSMSDSPSVVDSDSTIDNTSSAISKVKAFTTQALRGFTDIGKSTTIGTKIDIKKSTLDAIEYSVNLMQELEYRIDNVNDKLSLLDVKMENAVGAKKIEYLQKQNALYEEQAKLQKELYDNLTQEKGIVKDKLKNYGFKFDKQGNLTQYEEVLLKMEKRAKELEDQAEKASKKASDYDTKSSSVDSDKYDTSSKKLTKKQKEKIKKAKKQAQKQAKAESEASKKTKKSLQKKADSSKDASDEYKEKLEKVKDLTEQYLKMQRDEIPDAEKEWLEMQNAIKKNNDEIEKLELEDKLYKFKNSVTGLTNQYDIWGDKIDLIDTKLNNSLQTDKVSLYQQKLSALNKQLEIQEKTLDSLKNQLPVYQEALAKYGVQFGENGNIINMSNVLNKYQNSEDLEKINDLMEEYNDLIRDTIPNAQQEYEDLNNAIQDVYNSQLDVVKDIEDKITDVIKDQIDKRKDLIQKQYDKEIELLNKRKDEYNNNKNTNDYYKNLEEAQSEIDKIQAKINRLSFDNSLSSKSKISDLMDDLKDAQDKYNDLVNDRQDDLINNMYDDEIDRLQKEQEDKIQELEDKWSDSKIAELVSQALGTQQFIDIDGNVHNLQDTLISFAEESGDALGILGDKIKSELVLNLQDALEYAKDYSNIFDNLGLKHLGNVNYSDKLNNKTLRVDDISINVYGTDNMDEQKIAKEVAKQLDGKFSEITNGGLL